jgi:DNA mismatch repair protein MLH3
LTSLAALSLLTIFSKHREFRSTNRITLHRTEVLSRMTPVPASEGSQIPDHGTMITVRDLFGNMPVRVKHRSIHEQYSSGHDRTWDSLKHAVIAYILSWPEIVTIKLYNTDTGRSISISGRGISDAENSDARLGLRKTDAVSLKLSTILSQSDYADMSTSQEWIPASASSKSISIKGAIGLQPSPSRSIQFVSIGIHPLLPQFGSNEVYDHINRLFKQSDFGTEETDQTVPLDGRRDLGKSDDVCNTIRQKDLKTNRKGVDRWPMFNLHIIIKQSHASTSSAALYDSKLLQKVLDMIEALVLGWLSTHHIKSRNPESRKSAPGQSPSKSRTQIGTEWSSSTRPQNPRGNQTQSYGSSPKLTNMASQSFGTSSSRSTVKETNESLESATSRDKSAQQSLPCRTITKHVTTLNRNTQSTGSPLKSRGIQTSYNLSLVNFSPRKKPEISSVDPMIAESTVERDQAIDWTDPMTSKVYKVNARTGMPVQEILSELAPPSVHRLTMRPNSAHSGDASPGWLNDLHKTWKNPVFNSAEASIPYLRDHTLGKIPGQGIQHSHCRHETHSQSNMSGSAFIVGGNRLTKDSLRQARIVSQVDKQFILLALPPELGAHDQSDLLVAVDQHAADERVRVEMLYSQLCEQPEDNITSVKSSDESVLPVKHVELHPPLIFQVARDEGSLFTTLLSHFKRWGILYMVEAPKAAKALVGPQIIIKTLPTVIAERCKSEPELLIAMLRSHLWHVVETGSSLTTLPNEPSDDLLSSPRWLRQIGNCPQGILDMVNSRACRSAIMFNDALTMEECQTLIEQLSKCAFPFQCAHGRPSMAPLIQLGSASFTNGSGLKQRDENENTQLGFLKAVEKWKEGEILEMSN